MQSVSEQEKQRQPAYPFKNIKFQVIPVSPSNTVTPLQVVCFFDQTKNQAYAGGTEAVDEHFDGAIKNLRSENIFRGELFETLLITPLTQQIPADRLLLVGLGDPANLTPAALTVIGRLVVREAIKLGVASFCYAPSLKDAGVSTVPADEVSIAVIQGMTEAINAHQVLVHRKLAAESPLSEVIFLAGAQHLETSQAGIKKGLGL